MTPARVASVVDAAIGLRADVNLLLGDFLDSTALGIGRARVHDVAAELARIPDAAAVLGNHDWRGAGPAMRWALLDAGVRLLENEAVELRPGLWVAGTADLRHRHVSLAASLRAVPEDAAVLLCTHDPDLFPRVPRRVALTVAGHVHGGQVNVPILRRAVLPTRYGERYLHGHVVEGGRHLYVSSGLGTAGLPLAPAPAARAPRPASQSRRAQRSRLVTCAARQAAGGLRPHQQRGARDGRPPRPRRCRRRRRRSRRRDGRGRRGPRSRPASSGARRRPRPGRIAGAASRPAGRAAAAGAPRPDPPSPCTRRTRTCRRAG